MTAISYQGLAGLLGFTGRKAWLFYFGLWTLIGLIWAGRLYGVYNYNMEELWMPWQLAVTWGLSDWYLWGIASLAITQAVRRNPVDTTPWWRITLVHLLLAVLLISVQLYLYAYSTRITGTWWPSKSMVPGSPMLAVFMSTVMGKGHTAGLTYLLIAAVLYGAEYYAGNREKERRLAALELSLTQARLENLRSQLHPHFLFNTLNAIAALIPANPTAAERMISRLGDLLRISLNIAGAQETTLREELDFLHSYLGIQQERFGNRLRVGTHIDPNTLECRVPNLLLQPLVENAVRYAVSARPEGAAIQIRTSRRDGRLMVEVADDGPGLQPSNQSSSGVGLNNTRQRLLELYGTDHTFELRSGPSQGLTVFIDIPARSDAPGTVSG